MKRLSTLIILSIFLLSNSRADEGMWLPTMLGKLDMAEYQQKGLRLTADQIYSINHNSLKDAVVLFGGGCTGELISPEGLILTNHHCGFGSIQSHSSLENDYLTDGFWAKSKEEELPNPGLYVSFLIRIEDVTAQVLADTEDNMTEADREKVILKAIRQIEEEAVKGTQYQAEVKPFFYGNEFYLFVTETYNDVRLVGAPPSSIGKFGGDTDNWMWPRHTGDFSLFRVYANKDNKPAAYSPENVPLKPKMFLPVSLKGAKKGDLTMVYGFPGSTSEYLPAAAVEQLVNITNPARIRIRTKRLSLFDEDMEYSRAVRIQYASKHAGIANGWKKWIGQNKGLKTADAIGQKRLQQQEFQAWVDETPERKTKYGKLIPTFDSLYLALVPYSKAIQYFYEAALGIEAIDYALDFQSLYMKSVGGNEKPGDIPKIAASLLAGVKGRFKNYNQETDRKVCKAMLDMFFHDMDPEYFPVQYAVIQKKFKGDIDQYADYLFDNSIFVDQEKVTSFLTSYTAKSAKKMKADPVFALMQGFLRVYTSKIQSSFFGIQEEITMLMTDYMQAQREWKSDKMFYPDANSTMRISFGAVNDYSPRDAIYYNYFTTLKGVMEKIDSSIYDYAAPQKLVDLYETKDFGPYGSGDTMFVCFTSTNHTTGGNSGSPVINGNGELIGINFDRNWEGTMSDIMYDPAQCRNIVLDIRYVLFIIDKFAGASYLLEEMEIRK
ncbi:MAG: S46 family peptidase [Bacteroidetes bacterium]|nr:S46 family peptidase [Bacteroidota bacterium]MBU1717599.1 S46 family peptidase [Bacteroidota bacterium]